MPTSTHETRLARYHYDPLDRQVDCTPFDQAAIQRYYCKTRLATETAGGVHRSILQHDDQLLAQQQRDGTNVTSTLLATDQQRSVLNALDANQPNPLAYSPYGHRPLESGLLSFLGFNGERPDPVTGHYHLGNGYRQFNPVLMRFNSPDSWSPFGEGGPNAYMYCGADPINRSDPTGHFVVGLLNIIEPIVVIAGTVTFAVGQIIENDTISHIGLGIAMASTVSFIGRTGYKAINARMKATTRNLPPPSYRQLFPGGPPDYVLPSTDDSVIEMSRLSRANSMSYDSSSPPSYEDALEMSRQPHVNQVNSSVATLSLSTSDLQSRNATDIRQR